MANREFKKIERIMKDFSLSVGGGSDGFCVLLEIEDDRLLKYAPKQFRIVQQTEEEDEILYTGSVSVVDVKIENEDAKLFKLDIPMTLFYAGPYGQSTGRKIELNFKGISEEIADYENIETHSGTSYGYYFDEIYRFEILSNNFTGLLPMISNITIEEGGQ